MKSLFLTIYLLLTVVTSITTHAQEAALANEDLHTLCDEKPIWLAFGIESAACITAATFCAQKPEFKTIDPKVLSEAFYLCVFNQLNIELE